MFCPCWALFWPCWVLFGHSCALFCPFWAALVKSFSAAQFRTDASATSYRLEFVFDADLSCFVQLHFCAREAIGDDGAIQLVSKYPGIESSERYHFERGSDQLFNKFTFKPQRYDLKAVGKF